MRFKLQFLAVAGLVGVLAGCGDMLEVRNWNNPEAGRIFTSPTGVEAVIGGGFATFHNATTSDGLNTPAAVFALESYGTVNNFGMNIRGPFPRLPLDNQRGSSQAGEQRVVWDRLSALMSNMRTAMQALSKMDSAGLKVAGGTPGYNRDRAFGFFITGLAAGTLAMSYDSVAVATPYTSPTNIPILVSAAAAFDTAYRMLDSAEALATGMAEISGGWMSNPAPITEARFKQIIRSYKARFRANVARQPSDVVDWAKVRDDALAGITSDVTVSLGSGYGGGNFTGIFQTSASWHQVSLVYIGMADTSGAYQTFINTPLWTQKVGNAVLVKTPDLRWPQGETRTAQNADVGAAGVPTAPQYIVNRAPGEDQPDLTYQFGTSNYDHRRWKSISNANGNGTWTYMTKAETDLLLAEAYIRLNQAALAVPLINASRTVAGLPAADETGVTGSACVPRLPNGNCGDLMETLKYEKRMETQITGYMQWYADSRRWGDLLPGTALHWPVPVSEMDTRNLPYYNMPSANTLPGAASPNSYGWQ